jgi:hypothetical protein
MFTVLSNTRNFNLYLIAALAIMMVILLTFTVVPAISDPEPVLAPVSGISEPASDYYQRHPELRASVQDAAIPVIANSEASDYFQRHPELRMPGTGIDLTDYASRHPELSASANQPLAASDYFMRHPELTISVEASADLTDYFFRQELLSSGSSVDLTDYFFRHP